MSRTSILRGLAFAPLALSLCGWMPAAQKDELAGDAPIRVACTVNCDHTWQPPSYGIQGDVAKPATSRRPLGHGETRTVPLPAEVGERQCVPNPTLAAQGECIPSAGTWGAGTIQSWYRDGCGGMQMVDTACTVSCQPKPTKVSTSACIPANGQDGPGRITETWKDMCGNTSEQYQDCSIPVKPKECIAGSSGVGKGETACPTNTCFFYVSGIPVSDDGTLTTNVDPTTGYINVNDIVDPVTGAYSMDYHQAIGDTTTVWSTYYGPAGGDIVGPGEYADSYGNAGSPGPFYKAANGTFDGMALGRGTRVQVFWGQNFSGPLMFDQKGPMIVNNYVSDSAYEFTKTFKSSPLLDQFPPEVRYASNDPRLGIPALPRPIVIYHAIDPRLMILSGLPNDGPQNGLGFGPTSIKVTCDP